MALAIALLPPLDRAARRRRPRPVQPPRRPRRGDCATCHTSEGWKPSARSPPLRPPGHRLRVARRARPGRLPRLPPAPGVLARRQRLRRLPRGRASRRARGGVRRLPRPGVLDEPARVSRACTTARASRCSPRTRPGLRGLPPRPAAARVREHAGRLRGLPPARTTRPPATPITAGWASPTQCEVCHSPASEHVAGRDVRRRVCASGLVSAHRRARRAGLLGCHASGSRARRAQCVACHRDDYDRTTSPSHRASGSPTGPASPATPRAPGGPRRSTTTASSRSRPAGTPASPARPAT